MDEFESVDIGLNYGTTDTEEDEKDVILIGKNDNNDYTCIGITVEEARWLSKKLLEFADKFNKESDQTTEGGI